MYHLTIGQVSIDPTTLITAILALAASVILAFLGATIIETMRQNSISETEKRALRKALYSEIGWTLTNMTPILLENGY